MYWVFFWNFESEKFQDETKNFQAKIKIGQAELMNGQVFKSTFRTLKDVMETLICSSISLREKWIPYCLQDIARSQATGVSVFPTIIKPDHLI